MNKIFKSSALLVLPFMLSSCSLLNSIMDKIQYKEVEYSEFHEKAVEAWVNVPYTKATVNGKVMTKQQGMEITQKFDNVKVKVEDGRAVLDDNGDYSGQQANAASLINSNATYITDVSESSSSIEAEIKYYISSSGGFKIEETIKMSLPEYGIDENIKGTIKYDKYAMMTSEVVSGTSKGKITIKYSK